MKLKKLQSIRKRLELLNKEVNKLIALDIKDKSIKADDHVFIYLLDTRSSISNALTNSHMVILRIP